MQLVEARSAVVVLILTGCRCRAFEERPLRFWQIASYIHRRDTGKYTTFFLLPYLLRRRFRI